MQKRIRILLILTLAFTPVLGGAQQRNTPTPPRSSSTVLESPPLCPWRDPQRDLPLIFPGATNFFIESRIITEMMLPAQKRLGRLLNPGENPLRIHRPIGPGGELGSILVTRVKGEHGGIELVIGADTNQHVVRVIVQSHREPPVVGGAITSAQWLNAFVGKTSHSPFRLAVDLPEIGTAAELSARAVADGVRSQLIALEYAELLRTNSAPQKSAHVQTDH